MTTIESNVYYNPDDSGLTLVGELEDDNASWSFDTLIVLREDISGNLYAAHDSGCSCPCPFEDVRSFSDLTRIRSVVELEQFVKAHEISGWSVENRTALYKQVSEFVPWQL